MSYTLTTVVQTTIKTIKSPTGADAGNPDTSFTSGNPAADTYVAASSVPCSKSSKFTLALSSGTATLDLTAIPDDVNGTFDATGLKVQFLRFHATATNANKIVASNGASNPYRLDATTTAWSDTLVAGQIAQHELNNAGDTVGGSHKTIDFAGTLVQTIDVHIVVG